MKSFGNICRTLALLFAPALLSVGCSSEIQSWTGCTGIYFAMPDGATYANADTTYTAMSMLPFIVESGDEATFTVKVKILGKTDDHDRLVPVRVVPESTTLPEDGYELELGKCTVKAGEVFGHVPVRFHRLPELKTQELQLTIELYENEDFLLPVRKWRNSSTEYVDVVRHTVKVSDMYVQLPGYAVGHFGEFSQKKMKLLLEIFSMELSDFNQKLPVAVTKALGQKFDRYLKEQAAKGTPVYEEDGVTLMTSGKYIY